MIYEKLHRLKIKKKYKRSELDDFVASCIYYLQIIGHILNNLKLY